MNNRDKRLSLADRIEATKRGPLPVAGHVVNVTFSLDEVDMISIALRAAARPPNPECQYCKEHHDPRLACPAYIEYRAVTDGGGE